MNKDTVLNFRKARTMHRKRRFIYVLPCFYLFVTLFSLFAMSRVNLSDESDNHIRGRQLLQSSSTTGEHPNCIPPSIDSFPDDFFTQEQRQKGGVVIHFLIMLYTCAMLAVICDDYFLPSLDIISNRMNLPSDVAGATFMAIGTSSPELFSSVIGAFITEGDIGVGTVVGSAVFNVLGVTGLAGVSIWDKSIDIDWYPVTRDTSVYLVTISVLTAIISDDIVTWWESLILLIMFGMYIVLMYCNTTVEIFSRKKMKLLKTKIESWFSCCKSEEENSLLTKETKFLPSYVPEIRDSKDVANPKPEDESRDSFSVEFSVAETRPKTPHKEIPIEEETADSFAQPTSLCSPPTGFWSIFWWLLMWPASLLFYVTIPDCRKESLKNFFVITFLISTLWLGAISYVCVWMVTIIGYTLRVPDSVAGLTLLAIGTSLPEMLSSVIIARNGMGNMVMANLIGSNIFDILFCLGAPWLIKTLMSSERNLLINSSALTYTSTTLLTTVIGLLMVFSLSGWKLNRAIGFTCIGLYIVSVSLSCLYELNVFGYLNPPTC